MRFALALALATVAAFITTFSPGLSARAPTLLSFCAVMLSAWFGGFGPGFVATAAAVLTMSFLLLPPTDSFVIATPQDLLVVVSFIIVGLLTSVLGGAQRRAQDALRQAHDSLEKAVDDRTAALLRANASLEQEIRDRTEAEAALRRSEGSYRSLVHGAAYGIYRSTLAGKFLDVNPALVKMLGYASPVELMATKVTGIYVDPWQRTDEPTGPVRGVVGRDVEWQRKDGTTMTVRLSKRIATNEAGESESYEVIVEDLTDRRRLEDQLRQAQKMEALGLLASGVAHDFNNVLTAILGHSALMLQATERETPAWHDLNEIHQAAERAASLTQQLLAFGRQQRLQLAVVDLNAIVRAVEPLLRRLIPESIAVRVHIDGGPFCVNADVSQLEQILMNLAINARDAISASGGTITIQVTCVDTGAASAVAPEGPVPGRHVVLAVSDTGRGMDARTKAHLFEPFFTTKEVGKGTGLGLATVYGVVQQLGGYITVDSQPGRGTTLRIAFPAVDAPSRVDVVQPASAPARMGSETILVVEDEPPVRRLTVQLLKRHGYQVFEAASGAEALAFSESFKAPIQLMLTDVIMPGMNGPELVTRLKVTRPEMRVMFMSGYTGDALADQGVAVKIELVEKPFSPPQLLTRLRRLLDTTVTAGH